jgi:integral membrane protein
VSPTSSRPSRTTEGEDLRDSLRVARSETRPPIRRRRLNALRLVSLVDGLLLLALLYAAIRADEEAVRVLGPVHGGLFLVLLAGVAAAAWRGWWSWRFFAVVVVLGPLASIPGLEVQRARAARRAKFSASGR